MTQTTDTTSPSSPYYIGEMGDRSFNTFSSALHVRMRLAFDLGKSKLFSVNTEGLFDQFLASFTDPVERQYHNCHCCRGFIRRYGGLVTLSENGEALSAVWDPSILEVAQAPAQYIAVAAHLRNVVESSEVKTQFFWDDPSNLRRETLLGHHEAGGYSHFYLFLPPCEFEADLTPGQAMAVRREDRKHLAIALGGMKPELLDKTIAMLEAGGLQRSEALLPMGLFLRETQRRLAKTHGEQRNRILWHAVGQAARGWCTPRGSAFGALLYDVEAGRSVAAVARSHDARVDPTKYQRPQAPPSEGNVQQAEKIFESLGLASALRRRPMALEEAELFWRPRAAPLSARNGLFSGLQTKESTPTPTNLLNAHPTSMTFVKFARDVLPHALKMQFLTPYHGAYCGFTTAVDPEAQPILAWDSLERRNTGSWYFHHPYSAATSWGLPPSALVDVVGLSRLPPDWHGNTQFAWKTQGRVLIFLKGAADTGNITLGLFPSHLRGELHAVRATVEAHSQSWPLEEETRPRASGYCITGQELLMLEVTTEQGIARYRIDRIE